MSRVFPADSGIVLIGYRGTGKTTVGRLLARRLNRPFVDADEALEIRAGCSIRTVFETQGEPAFRDLEEAVIDSETRSRGKVLATGGGAILRDSNRIALRGYGFVVWLSAGSDVLTARLRAQSATHGGRPALTKSGTLGEVAPVLEVRTPIYRAVADAEVSTEDRTAEQVADAILALLPDELAVVKE